jgi:hypothetical protein
MSSTGYQCKECGGPSPIGVGYVDTTPGAADTSAALTVCGWRSRSRTTRTCWTSTAGNVLMVESDKPFPCYTCSMNNNFERRGSSS